MESKEVLILSQSDDAHVNFLLPKLKERDCKVVTIFTDKYPENLTLSIHNENALVNGLKMEPTSVWYRRPGPKNIKDRSVPTGTKGLVERETTLFLDMFVSQLGSSAKWINHPSKLLEASQKMSQLRVASSIRGILVPQTLVTNSTAEARVFCSRLQWEVVAKTIGAPIVKKDDGSFVNMYARKITKSEENQLSSLACCPTILQERIRVSRDFRVTVIGDRVFSFLLDRKSNESALDWRSIPADNLVPQDSNLPKDVELACLSLVQKFGLFFSTMDIVEAENGSYYFLDLNPNGQWLWLELDQKGESSSGMIEHFINYLINLS